LFLREADEIPLVVEMAVIATAELIEDDATRLAGAEWLRLGSGEAWR
jgi:hypothetical protein